MRFSQLAAFCVVLSLLATGQASHRGFDISRDFSLENNPHGAWSYGYSSGQTLKASEFRKDEFVDARHPIGFWHPAKNQGPGPDYYPYVAFNESEKTEYGSSNGWAARAKEAAMEGSNTGQYSIVRFTAPKTGTYRVVATFTGIHFGLSTTDVHVMHNDDSLFRAEIDGYGGDPAFHPIQGANPKAQYQGEVRLHQGDTVDFAVGYGKNKTHFGDTTGLFAKVESK